MKWSRCQVKTVWHDLERYARTKYCTRITQKINSNLKDIAPFLVVTEPWKFGQRRRKCVKRDVHNINHLYSKYEALNSSVFWHIWLLFSQLTTLSADHYPYVSFSASEVAGSKNISFWFCYELYCMHWTMTAELNTHKVFKAYMHVHLLICLSTRILRITKRKSASNTHWLNLL